MAALLYNWNEIDWSKQDVVIARELRCSRERVRQKRIDLCKGKSPHYHEHASVFKSRILSLDTEELTIKEIVKAVKCSKAYAINMLSKLGKKYNKVDNRRGGKYEWGIADWSMKDREIARVLGVPNPATVTQHRRRLGIFKRRKDKVFVLVHEKVKEMV